MEQRGLSFSSTLECLKAGKSLSRLSWNGKGIWVKMQIPDTRSKMTCPYLYTGSPDGKIVPWLPSQADLFAEDWKVVD